MQFRLGINNFAQGFHRVGLHPGSGLRLVTHRPPLQRTIPFLTVRTPHQGQEGERTLTKPADFFSGDVSASRTLAMGLSGLATSAIATPAQGHAVLQRPMESMRIETDVIGSSCMTLIGLWAARHSIGEWFRPKPEALPVLTPAEVEALTKYATEILEKLSFGAELKA